MKTRVKGGTKETERGKDDDGAHSISSHAAVEPECRKNISGKTAVI